MEPITGTEIKRKRDGIFIPETIEKVNQLIERSFGAHSANFDKEDIISFIQENHPIIKDVLGTKMAEDFFDEKIIPIYRNAGWVIEKKEEGFGYGEGYFLFDWPSK